ELPVPATPGWTVTDVAVHVAGEPSRYHELALGGDDVPASAADLPAYNAARIRDSPTRDLGELAGRLRADTAALLSTMDSWRGLGGYRYAFTDGVLTVGPPDRGRADVHISSEPVTALLNAYGRIGPWRPALTGKVLVWGRRPWLAPGFPRLFRPA